MFTPYKVKMLDTSPHFSLQVCLFLPQLHELKYQSSIQGTHHAFYFFSQTP